MACENCKALIERIDELERMVKNQELLISRMIERKEVMCLKKELLKDLLLIKFNIQVIPPKATQYLDKKNPDEVLGYVKKWIEEQTQFSNSPTKCNENARAVWASLDGSLTKDWVSQSTQTDLSFAAYSFQKMLEKMEEFNKFNDV